MKQIQTEFDQNIAKSKTLVEKFPKGSNIKVVANPRLNAQPYRSNRNMSNILNQGQYNGKMKLRQMHKDYTSI